MGALVRRVPDIGEIFIEREGPFERLYRVTGYLKAWTPPKRSGGSFGDMLQGVLDEANREFDFGKGKTRVVSCFREEAEYVSGSGICGCIRPVEGLEIVGVVQWSKAQIDEARLLAMRRVGEVLF